MSLCIPSLGQAEGLRRLVEFLRVGVAAQARSHYAALSNLLEGANAKKVDFASALSLLFKVGGSSVVWAVC